MIAFRCVAALAATALLCWIQNTSAVEAPEPPEKPVEVTAEQLAKDYTEGGAAFNKKWEGKTVLVKGEIEETNVVASVTKDQYLTLLGFKKKGDPVSTIIRCRQIPEFKDLKKGKEVTIQGKVQKHSDTVFAVELAECKLVKGGK